MDETAPIGNQHVTPSGAARRSELRHALRQRPYRTGLRHAIAQHVVAP